MRFKIAFNSPVILIFFLISFVALSLSWITNGASNDLLFSVYNSSLTNPFTYIRFFGHIFGSADWSHFIGNAMLLLVIGPMIEEKYGSYNLVVIIVTTAILTGLVNFVLFPDVRLLGASGVVFALILLSSFSGMREGQIPMTFILVAVIYIGGQVYDGLFVDDNVSNLTHIIGGAIGAGFGFYMNTRKMIK